MALYCRISDAMLRGAYSMAAVSFAVFDKGGTLVLLPMNRDSDLRFEALL